MYDLRHLLNTDDADIHQTTVRKKWIQSVKNYDTLPDYLPKYFRDRIFQRYLGTNPSPNTAKYELQKAYIWKAKMANWSMNEYKMYI